MLEIQPANISQVLRGRRGGYIVIENDVCDIAGRLREIDERLRLKYSWEGGYFMVVLAGAASHGRDHLVTTAQEADARLVERVSRLARPDYDPGAEMEATEAQIDREHDKQFSESIGEVSERLAHAIRQDLKKGRPGPVYIPPDAY